MQKYIELKGLKQNNLRNISVQFPIGKLCVITGLSGSGKSSLAFESLYAEGQRRYIESLSTYTRQFLEKMPKPHVESIKNIPPSIALEQRNHVVNSRSTVGTQTEIVDYLRVLYSKIGKTYCQDCGTLVIHLNTESISGLALEWMKNRKSAFSFQPSPILSTQSKKNKKTFQSFFDFLKQQGFSRMGWQKSIKDFILFDLDECPSELNEKIFFEELQNKNIYIIIDRFKITSDKLSNENHTRFTDSLEQTLKLGHGEMTLIDLDTFEKKSYKEQFACPNCSKEYRTPEPQLFSFNSPLGACQNCSGFGHTLDVDEALVVPEPHRTLKNGAIDPLTKPSTAKWQEDFFRFAERHKISIGKRYCDLTKEQKKLLWEGHPKDKKFSGILGCFKDLERYKYKIHIRVFIRRYQSQTLCKDCHGTRLCTEARSVKISEMTLPELTQLSVQDSKKWFNHLELTKAEKQIAKEALEQVERRLALLDEVGVGYLTLSRLTKTLSGGEFQRINLSTQLGNGLCGTLYVLDEPSIGLHAYDTGRLIRILKKLRDQGNTLVVVEHDLEVMKNADWLVELGPGAGFKGGDLIVQGPPEIMTKEKGSLTGKYLRGDFNIPQIRPKRGDPRKFIKITGCKENNLKNIDVDFPLERFVVVTGVSGSGKTTLVHKTLFLALNKLFKNSTQVPAHFSSDTKEDPGEFSHLYGAEQISGIVLLDQKPIGKSSRSNPATYLKAWDEVRKILAHQVSSLKRGYTPQHFSFNIEGGRCPICKGEGEITLDMHFLAEIKVPCDECHGKKFKKEVLNIKYKGKNVFEILNLTIDEAYNFFRDNLTLSRKLSILRDVGLGYLHLGQPAPSLSGGESQRLKIASLLENRSAQNILYIFDEPTTGLHQEDIKKLLHVVHDLIDQKNSVIMIEHHMDLISQADWVIDIGTKGGVHGGNLVGSCPPSQLLKIKSSITGQCLEEQGFYTLNELDRE